MAARPGQHQQTTGWTATDQGTTRRRPPWPSREAAPTSPGKTRVTAHGVPCTDGGATWVAGETRLDTGVDDDSFDVAIAAVGEDVYVVWQAMDWTDRSRSIYLAASLDGGASFSMPVEVDHHPDAALGISRSPAIVADADGRVIVAWTDNRFGAGAIFVNTSDDGGTTWLLDDVRVDPSTLGAESGAPVITSDGTGRVVVAWEDEAPEGLDTMWKVFAALSVDEGETFAPAERLDDDPLPHDSREPSIAVDPDGAAMHVVWRDMRNGLADIYLRSLELGTLTWDAISTRIDVDSDGMGNSTHPQVAADDAGRVWVVWEDDRDGQRDIYLNFSLDGGVLFQPIDLRLDSDVAGSSDSQDPHLAITTSGVVVVWVDHRNGDGTIGDIYARSVE